MPPSPLSLSSASKSCSTKSSEPIETDTEVSDLKCCTCKRTVDDKNSICVVRAKVCSPRSFAEPKVQRSPAGPNQNLRPCMDPQVRFVSLRLGLGGRLPCSRTFGRWFLAEGLYFVTYTGASRTTQGKTHDEGIFRCKACHNLKSRINRVMSGKFELAKDRRLNRVSEADS